MSKPPEPREPAAREAVEAWFKLPNHDLGFRHEGCCEDTQIINTGCIFCLVITAMVAYSAELRAENKRLREWNNVTAECAAQQNIAKQAAEARVKELETGDIQRAKDITRLTIERDAARETNRELNRRNQELTRSLNLETGRKAWYGYFQAALHLLRDEGTKREAAEASLLQAREALESLKLPNCGENASLPIEEVSGCGQQIHTVKDLFRCGDCEVPFHQQCLKKHFAGHVASTSAPEETTSPSNQEQA